MSPLIQEIIVGVIIAAALGYLAWKSLARKKSGCGSCQPRARKPGFGEHTRPRV